MQKLFDEVGSLDKRCYDEFFLSEDILMEHAANAMAEYIEKKFKFNSTVLIVCGRGNNGADGIALSRLLAGEYDVKLFLVDEPKSKMAKLQLKRAKSVGVEVTTELRECDVVVDALYGTGFSGVFNYEAKALMKIVNSLNAFKIACDVPSGLHQNGEKEDHTFCADVTLTMGALKKMLYSDGAKDFVGDIEVVNLGVAREVYEKKSSWLLLDEGDLQLPNRQKKNAHKGSFGHLSVLMGEKRGAGILCATSALRFGAGLVTVLGESAPNLPLSLMHSQHLPTNTTAIAMGMGLGNAFSFKELESFLAKNKAMVVDADIFTHPIIKRVLKKKGVVITPHPKEFVALLKKMQVANVNIEELQKNRFKYVEMFCKNFPNIVLLLKGANVIIAQGEKFYINPHGTQLLAKGGSGDVLSGLIGALLAQGNSPLDSTINASLAHTKLAKLYTGADFSLTPEDLVELIGNL